MRYARWLALLASVLWHATALAAAPSPDPLTDEQREWLDAHPVIRLAPDPDFAPIEFFSADGTYSGLAADYARLVARKLGCEFTIVRCASWSEVLEKAQRREVDLLNAAVRTPDRERYLRFCRPYLHMPMVIITRQAGEDYANARALSGKRVALVRNYGHAELIVRENPAIRPLPVPDAAAGLRAVAFGEADAFYHDLATASFAIEQQGITTLRVSGVGSIDNRSGFAVRGDWEPLVGILERGMALVTAEEFAALQARWITMRMPTAPTWRDYLPQLAVAAGIGALLLALALLGNLALKREVARRTQELQKTEQMLRTALRIGQMGYGRIEADGAVHWSAEARRLHGVGEDELLTRETMGRNVHPDDRERLLAVRDIVRRGEFAPGIEYRVLLPNGRVRWLYGEWQPQYDRQGRYAGVIGINQDITTRKEHEEELRRERDFVDQVMNAQTDTVVVIAPDGSRLLRWNRATCAVTGYSDDELARLPLTAVHPPRCAADLQRALAVLERDGELTVELPLLTKDGRELAYEFNVTLVRDTQGQPFFLCSMGRDITERNAIAQVLRENERQYRLLAENTHDVIWACDLQMRFTYMSPSVERLLGYSPEECCRLAPQGTLTAEALATVQQALQEELAKEAARPGSAQGRLLRLGQRHRDGRIVPTEVTTAFVRDTNGRITGLTGVTRDIGERVAMEEQLRASEARYRSLFATMTDGVALHELVNGPDGTPCDYRILDVNPAYERILGLQREQVVGKTATEAYGVSPAPYLAEYAQVARTGIPRSFTTYFAPMDRHFHISAYAPAPGRFATVFEDVTDRLRMENALRETQEQFSAFMRHSPIYAFIKEVTATESRVLQASENYVDMIGVPGSAMIGKTMDELFPADFARKITADDWTVVQSGQVLKLDEDLGNRHYTTIKFPIVQGSRTLLAGYTIDITDRKRAEEALRAEEERYRSIIEQSSDAIFQGDPQGNLVVVNAAAVALTGVSRAELLRRNMRDLFPPEELLAKPLRYDLLRQGHSITAERQLRRADGTVLTVEMTSKMLSNGTFLCAMRDITERSRLLAELRASTERYQTLFSVESDAILLTDAETGRIIEANPAACEFHGYDHAEMLGMRLSDLSAEPEETRRVLDSASDEPIRIPLRWHRKRDGTQFPVEITARFFTLAGRRLLLGTLRDIGDRLRQEAERERLLAALTAANNDLRSLDELKSNLLSNVSHELRTPLVAVRGYAEMMREGMSGPVTARQAEQFGIMLRNIDRLLGLIDNLLDYSRQQKGQEPLRCATVPVADLLNDAVALLLPRAQEKQVVLHLAEAGAGLQLTGDRRKLQQVLINLVDNALKFTPQGGTVTLAARPYADDTICLTVQDTGIGIPEHQHERIFERFYQVDSSSTRGHGGTGIGLAIVRDIVKLHGGTVTVSSTPGEGALFTVTLPLSGPLAASPSA